MRRCFDAAGLAMSLPGGQRGMMGKEPTTDSLVHSVRRQCLIHRCAKMMLSIRS